MAYMSSARAKEIRQKLRKEFPSSDGWKLSVTNDNYSSLNVRILEAPIDFKVKRQPVNHYWLKDNHGHDPEVYEALKKMKDICMDGNWDNSEPMVDYFDVGWYIDIQIGSWDKDFIYNKRG
jgi:hypothetical protein